MDEQSIVKKAGQAFRNKQYSVAKSLYEKVAAQFGHGLFEANIQLCERRLSRSEGLPATTEDKKITLEQQLQDTQQLLEHYFTRSQELEYQLFDK